MKTKKKIALTALSALLVGSLVSGTVVAFAHQDTQGHEFNKYDVVWEDFDKDDDDFYKVVDKTTTTGTVDLGEKPYFHVEYDNTAEGRHADEAGAGIYKQGFGGKDTFAQTAGNTLNFVMRAPDEDKPVKLSDLQLGIRDNNKGDDLAVKNFAELQSPDSSSTGTFAQEYGETIDSEWETYTLAFGASYGNVTFEGSELKVSDAASIFVGLHLYTVAEAVGTLDIACIYLEDTAGEVTMLNNFMGGDTALDTAKAACDTTWWATKPGEGVGEVVKRQPAIKGEGSFTVIQKDAPITDYQYAVIETSGDTTGLTVSTTKDNGATWSTPVAYDGSVKLEGGETGFKFENTGDKTVKVTRIYLTNLFEGNPATAVPVIDASTIGILDSFTVAQKDISGDYDAMIAESSVKAEGIQYRLCYSGSEGKADPRVEVKDGSLVVDMDKDAPGAAGDYVNVKIHSFTAYEGKFIVFKMKAENGATLQDFRFGIMPGTGDSASGELWYKDGYKAGFDFVAPGLDESNPYKDGDWYFLVIDIEETGFPASENGYSGVNMYFGGEGKLSIDAIFFADEVPETIVDSFTLKDENDATKDFVLDYDGSETGYKYFCRTNGFDSAVGNFNAIAMDLTVPNGTDLSELRFEFGNGVFYAGGEHDLYLCLNDGTLLADADYKDGVKKTVYIDLDKSGIQLGDFHIHYTGDNGAFKMENVKAVELVRTSEVKAPDATSNGWQWTVYGNDSGSLDFLEATVDGYAYMGYAGNLANAASEGYDILAMDITVGETGDETAPSLAELRFVFSDSTNWAGENPQGALYTIDGKLLAETKFQPGVAKTVYIDLEKSGIKISDFGVHVNGTGYYKIENVTFVKYVSAPSVIEAYKTQLAGITAALNVDRVAPVVTITTSNKATAGDEIEIKYTATDDKTANLTNVRYEVVDEESNVITVTNGKFTATAAGVYTVTVYVTDEAGNEGNDVLQITVSEAQQPGPGTDPGTDPGTNPGTDPGTNPGTENPKEDKGTNLTWLWVLLGIVGGCGIGVGVFFLVKKLRNKKN